MIFKRFAPPYPLLLGFVCALSFFTLGPKASAEEHSLDQALSVDSPASPLASDPAVTEDAETTAIVSEQPSSGKPPPAPDFVFTPDHVSKRLFGVIPNNRADQTLETYTPLTAAEKFRIARSDSFDWPNYFLLAGIALESQVAAGGFSHNGGMTGFGEAYGRGLGDQIIGSYVTEAILPTLLHEDPRYFRLGRGTFWRRVGYATSRIFVTRKDNGRNGFNISEIAGNAGFVALATTYYNDERSASEAVERYGLQLGNDMVTNLLTEFWPDIKHRLRFPRRRLLIIP